MNKVGVFLTTQQIRTIKDVYSRQNKEQIYYRDFLEDTKYSISEKIANLLSQSFQSIVQKQGDRSVTVDRLNDCYNAKQHPKVISRILDPETARQIFITGMSRKANNGVVSKQAFIDYYAELNFCTPIQKQTYLQKMLMGTWNLVNPDDYVSPDRIRELELVVYEKIRQKSNGKTNQWKTAKKALAYFDLNDNAVCEFQQFKKGMDKFGCNFKEHQLRALFKKYDADRSGKLDYEEFSKMIMDIDISGLSQKPNLFTQTMGKNHFTITK